VLRAQAKSRLDDRNDLLKLWEQVRRSCNLCIIVHLEGAASAFYSERKSINHNPKMTQKLDNYLRTHRKNSGLSQQEVAVVVGCCTGAMVSRHERSHHLPPLRRAIAYEALFGVPISDIFAGLSDRVEKEIETELRKLERHLQSTSGKGRHAPLVARKLVWMAERRDFQHAK